MAGFDNFFDTRRYFNIASPQEVSPLARAYRGVTFGPTMVGKQDFARVSPGEDDIEDPYVSALSKMGAGNAINAYRSHLNTMPNQQDYAPSRGRRLAGALTAAAASFGRTPQNAIALGQQITDAPYRNALESWNMKGAGLKEQAGLEAADQTAQIARMKQILDYKDKMADNLRADKAQQSTEEYQRARIAALKQQGWKDTFGPNGELVLYNPTTGEVVNTGMQTSKSTELGYRKYELGQGDRRIAQGDQGVAQGWARVGQENTRIGQAERGLGISQQNADANTRRAETSGYIPVGSADAAETSAARNIVQKHPEFGKYLDDKGFIKLPSDYAAPWYKGGGTTAPDPATDENYKAFLSMVGAEKRRILNARRPGMFNFEELK